MVTFGREESLTVDGEVGVRVRTWMVYALVLESSGGC
jgi:hypothetical protein